MAKEEILKVKELAEHLKMDEHTVYRLARKRILPAVKTGGEWRFRKDLVDKWIKEKSLSKNNR